MDQAAHPDWDRHGEIAGLPLFWREAPGERPVLYVHGSPTSSDDYLPFLARFGGLAPDLPGFGRSGKPAAFDYSPAGYGRFLGAFVAASGLERFSLVLHDWGAVALAMPAAVLARVDRLVVMNAVPFDGTYRWHRFARLWRTPLVGELTMGFTTKLGLRWGLGRAIAAPGPVRADLADRIWEHFDHGTQRAILKLYRSAPPDELARLRPALAQLRCPALMLWGDRDPYIAAAFAESIAAALGGAADVEHLADAGHWPWLDRPGLIARVATFLEGS